MFVAGWLLGAGPAGMAAAHGPTAVVLVRPPQPSPLTVEATVRLRGELVAAGFDVQEVESPLGADIRATLEQAAARPGVEAVVAILGDSRGEPPPGSAELWVIDRVTGKTVVRRVPNAPGLTRSAEILSIRALELLRASFLEVAMAAWRTPKLATPTAAPEPPAEVTRFAETALEDALDSRPHLGWAVEVGGCVIDSTDRLQPSLVPMVRLERSFGAHFLGRIAVAGLGTQSHVETATGGSADISQQFGLLEGVLRFRQAKTFQPVLSLGAGALRVAAVGHVSTPYEGLNNALWTLLLDAGTGVHVPISGPFEVSLEVHAQAAQPYPVVRFIDVEVAREGRLSRPTIVTSLSVMAWL